ncbi:MAG: glycosyltransferase family 9 protein [Ignavibacteria bacterium]|jgi:heptosyltransferase-2
MEFQNILIIQTAFAGDVILTLPILEAIKEKFADTKISFLCIPNTASILLNNPFIDEVIIYDKKGSQKGILQFRKFLNIIKSKNFDLIISPHRSLRSTMISYFSKVKDTISFDTSAFSSKYKTTVVYKKNVHEIVRNFSLLAPLGIVRNEIIPPKLFTLERDIYVVDKLLSEFKIGEDEKFVTIAPGSVWFTKAYPEIKFAKMISLLNEFNVKIVLVGGEDDIGLCAMIKVLCRNSKVCNAAGKLTYLQSADLIRRSKVLVTNDSAPLHLANAVDTKVIAVFGATIPEFGFYPYGKNDYIFQVNGLKCRPCGIHGGNRCPIKTFECMNKIDETDIALEVMKSVTS